MNISEDRGALDLPVDLSISDQKIYFLLWCNGYKQFHNVFLFVFLEQVINMCDQLFVVLVINQVKLSHEKPCVLRFTGRLQFPAQEVQSLCLPGHAFNDGELGAFNQGKVFFAVFQLFPRHDHLVPLRSAAEFQYDRPLFFYFMGNVYVIGFNIDPSERDDLGGFAFEVIRICYLGGKIP